MFFLVDVFHPWRTGHVGCRPRRTAGGARCVGRSVSSAMRTWPPAMSMALSCRLRSVARWPSGSAGRAKPATALDVPQAFRRSRPGSLCQRWRSATGRAGCPVRPTSMSRWPSEIAGRAKPPAALDMHAFPIERGGLRCPSRSAAGRARCSAASVLPVEPRPSQRLLPSVPHCSAKTIEAWSHSWRCQA